MDYDEDKQVPLYGFGARVNLPNYRGYGNVSHCFPLNGNEANPNVYHVNGIMFGYRHVIPYL
jgi:hypothetical protein